uniref:DUF4440 domain-containing protein n=1 Tax=Heterorhabditis bacteriophora TaxID=37862 RepID=A0A1I7XFU3_HETBA
MNDETGQRMFNDVEADGDLILIGSKHFIFNFYLIFSAKKESAPDSELVLQAQKYSTKWQDMDAYHLA